MIDSIDNIRAKEKEGIVSACPRCGRHLLASCYHDGDDVSAKFMPVDEAIKLRTFAKEAYQKMADRTEEDLRFYRKVKAETAA